MNIQEYVGPGYPFVIEPDESTVTRLKGLFNQKDVWTSAELNERLGWQFSQAIFYFRRALRKDGTFRILTEALGDRKYQYRLIAVDRE